MGDTVGQTIVPHGQRSGRNGLTSYTLLSDVRTADFHYDLPPELIAQSPALARDQSRLLVVHRDSKSFEHRRFPDLLDYLRPGDLLVANDSKVLPARLRGVKLGTQGAIEILLVEENGPNDWWVLLRPGKRVRAGTLIQFNGPQGSPTNLRGRVLAKNDQGHCRLLFEGVRDFNALVESLGETPLPPYIERAQGPSETDRSRYQTVYARAPGSVAAPTAGLHFTPAILSRIEAQGVELRYVTLHVGLGTFAPVKAELLRDHVMHPERFEVSVETSTAVNSALENGRRVIAVGTTSVRVLESVALENRGRLVPGPGKTRLFLYPPAEFRVVSALLTNFHLPESTLLMLVSAFAAPGQKGGRELVLEAYGQAVKERYRFFSYGDAMLLL